MNWVDIAILVVWAGTASWGASMGLLQMGVHLLVVAVGLAISSRSEEHTSELQSRTNLVCRLLLEKKKKQ